MTAPKPTELPNPQVMAKSDHFPTPRPWEATHFCKEDGTPIATVEDVIATMGASALKMETPVLYGVTEAKDDYDVICYTGNGPKGLINAQLIAHASNRYDALEATNKALLEALTELVAVKKIRDLFGKTPAYENRKAAAWSNARAALKSAEAK